MDTLFKFMSFTWTGIHCVGLPNINSYTATILIETKQNGSVGHC
jgi:hypothetical protein